MKRTRITLDLVWDDSHGSAHPADWDWQDYVDTDEESFTVVSFEDLEDPA